MKRKKSNQKRKPAPPTSQNQKHVKKNKHPSKPYKKISKPLPKNFKKNKKHK
jgi:hypothetical protein